MVYWQIIRFSFLRFFSYPFEIFSQAFKRLVEVFFLIIFWSIYAQTANQQISIPQISGYFLLAMGIADLSMARWGAFSNVIGQNIRTGQISNYLLRPANIVWTLYSLSVGRNGLRLLFSILCIVAGVIVNKPQNLISLLLFVIFLFISWSISFAYNLFVGTLYIHFTEAGGIRNCLENFIRLFTGIMIPIYLMPEKLQHFIRLTPFPSMIYSPANSLNYSNFSPQVFQELGIGVFWILVLNLFAWNWWKKSMKQYEAIGI